MIVQNPKFVCLDCCNEFEKECKHISIDSERKRTYCDNALFSCDKCHSKSVIPFETRKYKVTIECEYNLDVSPVENDMIHSEYDGADEDILKSIINDSLHNSVASHQILKVEKMKG